MRARAAVPDLMIAELDSARRFLLQALAEVPTRFWARTRSTAIGPLRSLRPISISAPAHAAERRSFTSMSFAAASSPN